MNDKLIHWLGILKKKPDLKEFMTQVTGEPELIATLLEIIKVEKGTAKYNAEKIIRYVSERDPALIYPYFEGIASLLSSPNNFIKWGAVITLANLVPIDSENRFDAVFDQYFSLLNSESMIGAANVISNTWKIILAKPDYEPAITERLFQITKNVYLIRGKPSPECKNILYGQMLECFDKYFAVSASQEEMIKFAVLQRSNSRKQVARKAENFLKKHVVLEITQKLPPHL